MVVRSRVLFLCTGNSARSQMAEGLLRSFAGDRFEVHSAGTDPKGVNPLTVAAMSELAIDISKHESKHLDRYVEQPWDYVITVCDAAAEVCPVFPGGVHRLHWSFPDPAAIQGSAADRLAGFGEVRDAIATQLRQFIAQIDAGQG